jgi:EmrB/QacA subfamily drug resistance transporter
VLFVSVVGSGVVFLDSTAVNVALPALQSSLGADLAAVQWTVDAYLLTLSALLLLGGSLGDRYGRRRIFVLGLLWFLAASIACAFAPTAGALIAARAAQGAGGALLVPMSLALLRAHIEGPEQARAIGAWAGLSGVTTAVGPALGGWLVERLSWRAVFLINVPVVALAVWAALRFVPRDAGRARGALDVAGAILAALGLGGCVYALIEAPAHGGTAHPAVLVAGAAGVAALAAFLVVEARAPDPMLPLSLFRSRQFSAANATTLAVYFALGGAIFLLVLELQLVLGLSPLQGGFALTPVTLLLLVLSPLAGRLSARIGPRAPMTLGPLCAAVGLWMLSRLQPGDAYARGVLPGLIVLGLGLAATVAPLTTAVLEGAAVDQAGIASAVNNAVARVAGLLAVAVLPLAGGVKQVDDASDLARGYGPAMRVAAAVCALGGLCSAAALRARRQEPPASGGALLTPPPQR